MRGVVSPYPWKSFAADACNQLVPKSELTGTGPKSTQSNAGSKRTLIVESSKYTEWPKNSYLVFNPKSKRISITYDGQGPQDLCLSSGKNLHEVLLWLCDEEACNPLTEDNIRQYCYKNQTIAQTVNKINQQINEKLHKIFGVNSNTRHELIYVDQNTKEIKLRIRVHEE